MDLAQDTINAGMSLRVKLQMEFKRVERKKHLGKPKCFFCGDRRSRTDDPLLAKQML